MFTRAELDVAHALVRSTMRDMPAVAWPSLAAPLQDRQGMTGHRVSLPPREESTDLALFRSWMLRG